MQHKQYRTNSQHPISVTTNEQPPSYNTNNIKTNKLDLIFQKQPPQVQQKLMNLLIQYNAVMQYNKNEDKFEVDLLLPFKDQSQKQVFVNNFMRRNKANGIQKQDESQEGNQQGEGDGQMQESYQRYISRYNNEHQKDNSSHSNNAHNNIQNKQQHHKNTHTHTHTHHINTNSHNNTNSSNGKHRKLSANYSSTSKKHRKFSEKLDKNDEELSFNFTNQIQSEKQQPSKIEFGIDFGNLANTIAQKIAKAVQVIQHMQNNKGNHQLITQNTMLVQAPVLSALGHKYQENLDWESKGMQPDINRQQQQDNIQNSNRQKNQINQPTPQINTSQIINTHSNYQSSHNNSNAQNQIFIDDNDEDLQHNSQLKQHSQNGQQLHQRKEHNKEVHNRDEHHIEEHHIAEQSYQTNPGSYSSTYDYPQIIEEGVQQDEDESKNAMNYVIGQDKNRNDNNALKEKIKLNLQKKYKNHNSTTIGKKKPSATLRQRYGEFLKKNHNDINKLYDNIRKDIAKNSRKLGELRRNDPILVLEENIKGNGSEEDHLFGEQIIQHYHQNIVVQNQNMSSEDLVRYFRYLLQNARSLYLKHLTKSK